jgi:DNA-binding NtrC family response regulator
MIEDIEVLRPYIQGHAFGQIEPPPQSQIRLVYGERAPQSVTRKVSNHSGRRSGGDRQKAAHMLGIGKTTIYRKLKEYQRATTG